MKNSIKQLRMAALGVLILGVGIVAENHATDCPIKSLGHNMREYLSTFLSATDLSALSQTGSRWWKDLGRKVDHVIHNTRFSEYKSGTFVMKGYNGNRQEFFKTIEIVEGFELSDEISQEQFVDILGINPSRVPNETKNCGKDGKQLPETYKGQLICRGWPVTDMTMFEIRRFISLLNKSNRLNKIPYLYDLPFDEEEAYAQVGGYSSKEYQGQWGSKEINNAEQYIKRARVGGYFDDGPGPINAFEPFPNPNGARNALGLVLKKTRTEFGKRHVAGGEIYEFIRSKQEKIEGDKADWGLKDKGVRSRWVVRGINWSGHPESANVAYRSGCYADDEDDWVGFRLLRTLGP